MQDLGNESLARSGLAKNQRAGKIDLRQQADHLPDFDDLWGYSDEGIGAVFGDSLILRFGFLPRHGLTGEFSESRKALT